MNTSATCAEASDTNSTHFWTIFGDRSASLPSNNAAERALRGIAVPQLDIRRLSTRVAGAPPRSTPSLKLPSSTTSIPWLGSPTSLARLQDHPAKSINDLLPWNWKTAQLQKAAA